MAPLVEIEKNKKIHRLIFLNCKNVKKICFLSKKSVFLKIKVKQSLGQFSCRIGELNSFWLSCLLGMKSNKTNKIITRQ